LDLLLTGDLDPLFFTGDRDLELLDLLRCVSECSLWVERMRRNEDDQMGMVEGYIHHERRGITHNKLFCLALQQSRPKRLTEISKNLSYLVRTICSYVFSPSVCMYACRSFQQSHAIKKHLNSYSYKPNTLTRICSSFLP
jgi:hypothetical protein